jgi:hypothetical protein
LVSRTRGNADAEPERCRTQQGAYRDDNNAVAELRASASIHAGFPGREYREAQRPSAGGKSRHARTLKSHSRLLDAERRLPSLGFSN